MATLSDEELATSLGIVSKRFNNVLYSTTENYTDGIKNLSDLKVQYGRKNGEKWVNNFTYQIGELITYNSNLYICLVANNLNIEPGTNAAKWMIVSSHNLQNGKFYAAAFCNFTLNSSSITISNNFNISAIVNNSGYTKGTSQTILLEMKFKESANISDTEYLVFPVIAASKNGSISSNDSYYKMQQVELVSKSITGFVLSTEFFLSRQFSVIIIPKQY